jgi:lipopolysaccharide/colanic/teichoic acid biosynthesis glycosyltransferase
VWYVRNWSLALDLSILFRTLKVVLLREGLYGEDGVARDLS